MGGIHLKLSLQLVYKKLGATVLLLAAHKVRQSHYANRWRMFAPVWFLLGPLPAQVELKNRGKAELEIVQNMYILCGADIKMSVNWPFPCSPVLTKCA